MATEAKVAGHYRRGQLEETILRAMAQMGKDAAHLVAADLAPIDEFHVGGLQATQAVAAHMDLRPGLRLLDVGSGIGGSARYFAAEHGCHVTGIDLTTIARCWNRPDSASCKSATVGSLLSSL